MSSFWIQLLCASCLISGARYVCSCFPCTLSLFVIVSVSVFLSLSLRLSIYLPSSFSPFLSIYLSPTPLCSRPAPHPLLQDRGLDRAGTFVFQHGGGMGSGGDGSGGDDSGQDGNHVLLGDDDLLDGESGEVRVRNFAVGHRMFWNVLKSGGCESRFEQHNV